MADGSGVAAPRPCDSASRPVAPWPRARSADSDIEAPLRLERRLESSPVCSEYSTARLLRPKQTHLLSEIVNSSGDAGDCPSDQDGTVTGSEPSSTDSADSVGPNYQQQHPEGSLDAGRARASILTRARIRTSWAKLAAFGLGRGLRSRRHSGVRFLMIVAICSRSGCPFEFIVRLLYFSRVGRYTKMNPHRQVPTLRVDHPSGSTTVMWESNTIVRYLAAKYGPRLHGGTPEALAQSSMWMDWSLHGSNFAPSFGPTNLHICRARLAVRRGWLTQL